MTIKETILNSLIAGAESASDITKKTGKSKGCINRELRVLTDEGYVERKNVSRRGGTCWGYTVTAKGKMPEEKRRFGFLAIPMDDIGGYFA